MTYIFVNRKFKLTGYSSADAAAAVDVQADAG